MQRTVFPLDTDKALTRSKESRKTAFRLPYGQRQVSEYAFVQQGQFLTFQAQAPQNDSRNLSPHPHPSEQ